MVAAQPGLFECGRRQLRVIGALVIREMHTRFGRYRLGYVWLFFEPLLLGLVIGLVHSVRGRFSGETMRATFEFFAFGYALFFKFRNILNRAPVAIPANRGLLYHRQVTLPDLFYARHIIETLAVAGVLLIFQIGIIAWGSDPPDSPWRMIVAALLMMLLAQGMALMIGAITTEWEGLERFVHAFSYIMLPIGGVFYMVEWLPDWLREIVLWIPTVHIFELFREGQFGDRVRAIYDISYVISWILATHLFGLAALRVTRRRLGLE